MKKIVCVMIQIHTITASFVTFFRTIPILPDKYEQTMNIPQTISAFAQFFPKQPPTIYKNTTFTNKTKTLNIVHIVHLNQTNQQQPQQKSHNPHPLTQTPSKTSSKTPAITNHHRRESIPLINSIAFSKIFFTSDFVTPISFKVL